MCRDSLSEMASLGGLFDISVRAVSYFALVLVVYFSLIQTILQVCYEYFLYLVVIAVSACAGMTRVADFQQSCRDLFARFIRLTSRVFTVQ